MIQVNLVPAGRLTAQRRNRRVARWTTACLSYAALLVAVQLFAFAHWGDAGRDTYARLDDVRAGMANLQQQMGQQRIRMAMARRVLHADRMITQRPDWSIMLALLAESLGDEVLLRASSLDAPEAGAHGPADVGDRRTLHLRGLATTPSAVSQLALRLESTGLFAGVKVLSTQRDSYGGQKMVSFSIACDIDDEDEA